MTTPSDWKRLATNDRDVEFDQHGREHEQAAGRKKHAQSERKRPGTHALQVKDRAESER